MRRQNEDGGWGDTERSPSNVAATMLSRAAMVLAGMAGKYQAQLERGQVYVDRQGGWKALSRAAAGLAELRAGPLRPNPTRLAQPSHYGDDPLLTAPILSACALAGLLPWREVPPLRFELVRPPEQPPGFLRRRVPAYAVPAVVAAGQARFFHRPPRNPLRRLARRLCVGRSLKVLAQWQPPDGGFLESTPLTSFVVLSLAANGRVDHPLVRRGVAFLLARVRDDGSWPIGSSLAVWNTAQAVTALAAATGDVGALGCVDWLLESQHVQVHPVTRAAPGGWGCSDAAGAPPETDATAAALLALAVLLGSGGGQNRELIEAAASRGVNWLLDMQNDDGGWPLCCRGAGATPWDRSGCELTAHALRALHAWDKVPGDGRIQQATARGLDFLAAGQRPDGSWLPVRFGNQSLADEENPIYGTARVLLAYRDLGLMGSDAARRGVQWLIAHTNPGGGWGGETSVEETAVAVEALLAAAKEQGSGPAVETVLDEALVWLVSAVAAGRHREAAPIGLHCGRLWYDERLYPLVFAVAALGQAIRRFDER
jgi:squalene-hopene/tetraprenyl-beta-curcumene cyclase